MIRFIHLADLHLGAKPSYLGSRAVERERDFLDAFQRAAGYAIREELDFVVVAGDFFDSARPSDETRQYALAELEKLRQADIPVVLIPGNHDAIGLPGSVYASPNSEIRRQARVIDCPNPCHAGTVVIRNEMVHFYGMAWDARGSKPPFDQFHALDEPGYHLALLHGTVEEGRVIDLHSREVPLKLSNLAATGMDYIALGHIHAPQDLSAGTIPVVYPGTLEGRRFTSGEQGERSLVMVALDKQAGPEIRRIPWNRRTLQSAELDLNAEGLQTGADLAALIGDRYGDRRKLLRLRVTGTPPFVLEVEDLHRRLSEDFYWLQIQDRTEVLDSRLIEEWSREETIRGLFVRKMKERRQAAENDESREKIELAMKLAVQAMHKSALR